MSRKANPAFIGAFVIGAVILVLTGIILMSGRSLFEDKTTCVTYFEEGIAGLDIGSRVEMGGVRVGTVTDIRIIFDASRREVRRPVTFQLEHSRFSLAGNFGSEKASALLDATRAHGLRTQVALDNILTGKLKVNLVFVNDASPAPLHSPDVANALEVPSTPSPFSNLVRTAADLPLQDFMNDLHQAVKESQLVLSNSTDLLRSMEGLVRDLNSRLDPLMTNLTRVAENAERLTSPDSEISTETRATLEEVRAAARSVKEFSDYAGRHPESLLKGKP